MPDWTLDSGTCLYCDEPIRGTLMAGLLPLLGERPHLVMIWTHMGSGHERCAGGATYAAPRPVPAASDS